MVLGTVTRVVKAVTSGRIYAHWPGGISGGIWLAQAGLRARERKRRGERRRKRKMKRRRKRRRRKRRGEMG